MSFGFSAGDGILLVQLAWKTFNNAREACGEHDELTREVGSLHRVLRRLHAEVSQPDSLLNRADDNRRQELDENVADCERILKVMDTILTKYNALGDDKRRGKRLWQKIKFGNGEMKDLADIRLKIAAHTSAITMSLNLMSLGSLGRVEAQLGSQDGDLKGIRESVNWIAANMTAGNHEGSVWTSYTNDDKAFWRGLRGELVREGFPSTALRKHKLLIKSYIQELGERGVFDQQEELDSDNQYLEALDYTQPLPEDLLPDAEQVIDEKSSTGDFEHTEHERSEQSSLEDESGDSQSSEGSIESQQDSYSHTLPIPVECVVSFPSSVLSEVDTSDYSPALGAHLPSLPCSQHAACEGQESMLAQLDQPDIASVKSTETKDRLSRLERDTKISRSPQGRPLPVQIEDLLDKDLLPGAHHNTWSEPANVTNTRSNGIDNLSSHDQSSQLSIANEFALDKIESRETRFVFYRDVENWVEQLRPIDRGRVLEKAPVSRTLKEIVDQTATTSQERQAFSNKARTSSSCECEFGSTSESSLECSQPYDSLADRFVDPPRPKILSRESHPANRSNSSKSPTASCTDLVRMTPKIPPRDIKPTYLGSPLRRLLPTYPDELLNDTIICSHFQNLTPSDLKNFPESVQDAFIKQKTYTWEMPRDFGSRAYSVRHLAHLPSLPRKIKGCLHRTSTERLVSYTLVPDISSNSCLFYFRLRHMDNVLSAWKWHDSVEGFSARRPPSPVAVASVSPAHKSPYYVFRGGL